jgi:hypothetical protein
MTDRELAIAIAERIIDLQVDRALMAAMLDENFTNWKPLLKKTGASIEDSSPVSLRRELLGRLVDSPDDCTTLLSTIYRYMLTGFPDSNFPPD